MSSSTSTPALLEADATEASAVARYIQIRRLAGLITDAGRRADAMYRLDIPRE